MLLTGQMGQRMTDERSGPESLGECLCAYTDVSAHSSAPLLKHVQLLLFYFFLFLQFVHTCDLN